MCWTVIWSVSPFLQICVALLNGIWTCFQDTSIISGTCRWIKSRVWQGGTQTQSSHGTWPSSNSSSRLRMGSWSGVTSLALLLVVHLTSIHAVQLNKVILSIYLSYLVVIYLFEKYTYSTIQWCNTIYLSIYVYCIIYL